MFMVGSHTVHGDGDSVVSDNHARTSMGDPYAPFGERRPGPSLTGLGEVRSMGKSYRKGNDYCGFPASPYSFNNQEGIFT